MTTPQPPKPKPSPTPYAELPILRCGHCGRRFEAGVSPFCSARCLRAHAVWLDGDPTRTTAQRRAEMVARVDARLACAHAWERRQERKPYPGQRQWAYVRTVSTCRACGAVSADGWHRALRTGR